MSSKQPSEEKKPLSVVQEIERLAAKFGQAPSTVCQYAFTDSRGYERAKARRDKDVDTLKKLRAYEERMDAERDAASKAAE